MTTDQVKTVARHLANYLSILAVWTGRAEFGAAATALNALADNETELELIANASTTIAQVFAKLVEWLRSKQHAAAATAVETY